MNPLCPGYDGGGKGRERERGKGLSAYFTMLSPLPRARRVGGSRAGSGLTSEGEKGEGRRKKEENKKIRLPQTH